VHGDMANGETIGSCPRPRFPPVSPVFIVNSSELPNEVIVSELRSSLLMCPIRRLRYDNMWLG
jgi:hypothetical protein